MGTTMGKNAHFLDALPSQVMKNYSTYVHTSIHMYVQMYIKVKKIICLFFIYMYTEHMQVNKKYFY